jgi:hypothetical protein
MHVVVSHADQRSPFFILLIIVVVFDPFGLEQDFVVLHLLLMTQIGYRLRWNNLSRDVDLPTADRTFPYITL